MRTIVALTGVKGSGKTTSFDIIRAKYPEVIEVTLAAKLKTVCSEVLGVPRERFDDPALKERELVSPVVLTTTNVNALIRAFGYLPEFDRHVRQHVSKVLLSGREVAQYVGTEVLRTLGPDVHCEGAMRDLPESGVFVVTDMRFPSEFLYFQNRYPDAFTPLYIANYAAEAKMGPNPHASERHVLELAKLSERIDNNGTLQELEARVLASFETALTRAGYQKRAG